MTWPKAAGKVQAVLVGVGGLLALAGPLGCASGGGRSGHAGERPVAEAVRDPVLEGIPKPAGFVLDEPQSLAITAGRMRLAKCQYTGALHPTEVRRFYEHYMPSAGFTLKRWSLDHGEFNLRFESQSEVCIVRARPRGWNKTELVVELEPRPRGTPVSNERPPARRPR